MSQSTDPDHFFQTTDSLAESARKTKKSANKHGNPIRLPSKILAVIPDPSNSDCVYVAEAAGTARRVVLETSDKSIVFRGPSAPLTSLALSHCHDVLYAGCWDRTIWSWDVKTRRPGIRFKGHTDFVKCITILPLVGTELLISGSSDSTIILWNAITGENLRVIRGHSMGVLALTLDPISLSEYLNNPNLFRPLQSACSSNVPESQPLSIPPGIEQEHGSEANIHNDPIVFSASSDSAILRWKIRTPSFVSQIEPPLRPHETSIYALLFPPASTDLYTASADGTVQRLSREHDWSSDTTFQHGDYVRAVAVSSGERFVVTAGRSEDVRVWDGNTGKELIRWEGHYDEITGLVILARRGEESIVSVGIDGTVRTWPLSLEAFEVAKREREDEEKGIEREEEAKVEEILTAEEEAELAELMDY